MSLCVAQRNLCLHYCKRVLTKYLHTRALPLHTHAPKRTSKRKRLTTSTVLKPDSHSNDTLQICNGITLIICTTEWQGKAGLSSWRRWSCGACTYSLPFMGSNRVLCGQASCQWDKKINWIYIPMDTTHLVGSGSQSFSLFSWTCEIFKNRFHHTYTYLWY